MILASEKLGVSIILELYQRVLKRKGMPDEWQTIVLVSIFKEKEGVRRC